VGLRNISNFIVFLAFVGLSCWLGIAIDAIGLFEAIKLNRAREILESGTLEKIAWSGAALGSVVLGAGMM